jgi:hypothetical protein
MFDVALIELVARRLRPDVFVAAVLLAGDLLAGDLLAGDLVAGVAVARLADLDRLAVGAPLPAASRDLSRWMPSLGEFSLEPKAARTVANDSSSESWRVSTVTFMRCSWVGEWRCDVAMSDAR